MRNIMKGAKITLPNLKDLELWDSLKNISGEQ
jgi:hypothetical protein